MRVAGIDCGTNSIRLLISESDAEGALHDIYRDMRVVRLGEGVDATGRFSEPALERTRAAVESYAQLCRENGVESIRFAATSAARDAQNKEVFLSLVRELLGVPAQIISGMREAELSFHGACAALSDISHSIALADGPILTVDLGGGSTELTLGVRSGREEAGREEAGRVLASYSMDVGCVRMHERHLHHDPATPEEIEAARADVRAALEKAQEQVDMSCARVLIGLAGSVTTLTAFHLGLEAYDPQAIHGTFMSVEDNNRACAWMLAASRTKRASLGFMHPGRADVMDAGALVWNEVVSFVAEKTAEKGFPLPGSITSEHDILDGLAYWALTEPQKPFC